MKVKKKKKKRTKSSNVAPCCFAEILLQKKQPGNFFLFSTCVCSQYNCLSFLLFHKHARHFWFHRRHNIVASQNLSLSDGNEKIFLGLWVARSPVKTSRLPGPHQKRSHQWMCDILSLSRPFVTFLFSSLLSFFAWAFSYYSPPRGSSEFSVPQIPTGIHNAERERERASLVMYFVVRPQLVRARRALHTL